MKKQAPSEDDFFTSWVSSEGRELGQWHILFERDIFSTSSNCRWNVNTTWKKKKLKVDNHFFW